MKYVGLLGCVLVSLLRSPASGAVNLAVDASFESPLPTWLDERSHRSCYVAKELVVDAPDGRKVLAAQAWAPAGSPILSELITLACDDAATAVVSATVAARSFGTAEGAHLELALFDEKGKTKLASLAQTPLNESGQWQTLSAMDVHIEAVKAPCRLGIVISGPCQGARVELDKLGLFVGRTLGDVVDNDDLTVIEAEELADGKAWKVQDHYHGWYTSTPSGMKMLAGYEAVAPADNRPVSRTVHMKVPGRHVLWVRLLKYPQPVFGRYTITLSQNGRELARKEVVEEDARYQSTPDWWVWDSLSADLERGEARIELTRPAEGASATARKIDLFVLTNRLTYAPRATDFLPQAYMRFTNLSEGMEPYCLFGWIRRHEGNEAYAMPGILSLAGLSESAYVPQDQGKWLAPGQRSPWVGITKYLMIAGGRNNVVLTATRVMHTEGFVQGRIRGRLEFAVGDERRVVKAIDIDQEAPQILLTLPGDLQEHAQIKTADDYLRETEAAVVKLGPVPTRVAKHLDLIVNLTLQDGLHDPRLVARELAVLRSLGFNVVRNPLANPERAVAFHQEQGFLPRFDGLSSVLWTLAEEGSQWHPKVDAMEQAVVTYAKQNSALLPYMTRLKLMDEPAAMTYEQMVGSKLCQERFVRWLQARQLTPELLGVSSWDQAKPVLPKDSDSQKKLFYYTSLFRLEGFANLARACVEAKRKHLPDAMRTYVNFAPPTALGTWNGRGTDPFLAHRQGGIEMPWTEDWQNWTLGPQHTSDLLATLRAAGRPGNLTMGAYWVAADPGTSEALRMRFYGLLAGGVRTIVCYDYGPWYHGIDSWSRNFDVYPTIRRCHMEAAAIDEALAGTTRRKADVAILYSRTTGIWAKDNCSFERNASHTRWALAHAGYDADYLPEEDIEAGLLKDYKVLFMDGPWITRAAAEAVADWVRQGGVLVGSAGAGTRDPFDQPLDVLEPVFGARSHGFELKGNPSRPMYELRTGKSLARLSSVSAKGSIRIPETELDQLFVTEWLEAYPGAQVILEGPEKQTAGVVHVAGKGLAVRLAALPGLSYIHEAAQSPYDPKSFFPTAFRPGLRDWITWPAHRADAFRTADTQSSSTAEVVRYDRADLSVIFVMNHRTAAAPTFRIRLFDMPGVKGAYTATGVKVDIKPAGETALDVTLPMHTADAIVLTR